jgi:hypothetical protein
MFLIVQAYYQVALAQQTPQQQVGVIEFMMHLQLT